MPILLGILLGNLSAIAVNTFAWHLRRQELSLLIWISILSFLAFGYLVAMTGFGAFMMEYRSRVFVADDANAQDEMIARHVANILMGKEVACALFATSIGGLVQMRQIPTKLWKAFLALWGEIGFWFLSLFAAVFILGDMPELCSAFVIAFLITAAVLTFLRPVCLRWARPLWQVVSEMRIRKP